MPPEYWRWLNWIELDTDDLIFDGVCMGSVTTRLLLTALAPFALVLVLAAMRLTLWRCFLSEAASMRLTSLGHVLLPPLLVVTFCLINSVSRTVLNAIGACDSYYTDPDLTEQRAFLQMDLTIECGTESHDKIRDLSWVLFALWPIFFPVLYALLLVACRKAIQSGQPIESGSLPAWTYFLWREYDPAYFWWEPLDVLRKLALSSFVLFISSDHPMLRIIVGLLLSVFFLVLLFAANPYKMRLVSLVARSLQLSITLALVGALAIRLCDTDKECQRYLGFDSAYTASLLVLLLSIGGLVLVLTLLTYTIVAEHQAERRRQHSALHWVRGRKMVRPATLPATHFHSFLSHNWASGQVR